MEIKLEGSALSDALHAAILTALGDNGKKLIIEETIKYLTTTKPSGSGYGREAVSPLIEAIQRAANRACEQIVGDRLKDDSEFKAQLDAVFVAAMKQVFGAENHEVLVKRIADKVSEAINSNRY